MQHYFLRIGSQAEIHIGSALAPYQRGTEVAVRTPRGVEVAEITAPAEAPHQRAVVHRIVRPLNESDRWIVQQLGRFKRDAVESCRERLQTAGSSAVLLDVDQLLDGGTLVMQFLGELDEQAQQIVDEISEHYESIARSRQLTLQIEEGCGTDCSTEGCGSGCGNCGS